MTSWTRLPDLWVPGNFFQSMCRWRTAQNESVTTSRFVLAWELFVFPQSSLTCVVFSHVTVTLVFQGANDVTESICMLDWELTTFTCLLCACIKVLPFVSQSKMLQVDMLDDSCERILGGALTRGAHTPTSYCV